YARATGVGVFQSVGGPTPGLNAVAQVFNSAYIIGRAHAKATSTEDDAFATAYAAGVNQLTRDALQQQAIVTNTSGAHGFITGVADATAYARNGEADAFASAQGVFQSAQNAESFANQIVTNSGFIFGTAYAFAFGREADAIALGAGVSQYGVEIANYHASVTNDVSGVIEGFGQAFASGYGFAFALANGIGVNQVGTEDGAVNFSVKNFGLIRGHASAYATASFKVADAF